MSDVREVDMDAVEILSAVPSHHITVLGAINGVNEVTGEPADAEQIIARDNRSGDRPDGAPPPIDSGTLQSALDDLVERDLVVVHETESSVEYTVSKRGRRALTHSLRHLIGMLDLEPLDVFDPLELAQELAYEEFQDSTDRSDVEREGDDE